MCIETDPAIPILCCHFHTMKSGYPQFLVGDTLPRDPPFLTSVLVAWVAESLLCHWAVRGKAVQREGSHVFVLQLAGSTLLVVGRCGYLGYCPVVVQKLLGGLFSIPLS